MTTPTRLAEIAEILDPAIHTRPRINLYKADYEAVYRKAERIVALFTAAQARSREDAEIMREAAQALEQGHAYRVCHCVYCLGPEGDARGQHKPDCLVTKLRARADELEGRTDG